MAVKGLDRLKRQIAALPQLQRKAAATSLEQGAAELANAIARAAPADTGDLSASIGWAHAGQAPETSATQAIRKTPTARSAALGNEGLAVEVFAGNNVAFYARWVEFGTSPGVRGASTTNPTGRSRKVARTHPGSRAQPFFYPTVRALKKRLKGRVVRTANKAAKAAAAIK